MSTRLYSRNTVLLAKTETNEGVDVSPAAGSNAILVSDLSITPLAGDTVDLGYVRPYFGSSPSLRTREYVELSFTIDASGTTEAAGVAPPWSPLITACGFSENLQAAITTGLTVAATSTATDIKITGGSSTDGTYVGSTMTTTVSGSPESRTIIKYVGSTNIATVSRAFSATPTTSSAITIGANVLYLPVSTGFSSATIYYNLNGVRHKLLGARGTVSFTFNANERPTMKYTFTAVQGGIADASDTGTVYTKWKPPVAINSTNTQALLAGKLTNDTTTAASFQLMGFSLDMANAVSHRQLVGMENVILTDRKPAGNVNIEATTVAYKDWWADVRNITTNPFLIQHGTAAANTLALFMPAAQLTEPNYSDSDGISMLGMNIRALPVNGNDEVRLVLK